MLTTLSIGYGILFSVGFTEPFFLADYSWGVSEQNRKAQSKIEFISISIKICRDARTESKIEIHAKSNAEYNLLGPFATVHTCR